MGTLNPGFGSASGDPDPAPAMVAPEPAEPDTTTPPSPATFGGAHVHGDVSGGEVTLVGGDLIRVDRAGPIQVTVNAAGVSLPRWIADGLAGRAGVPWNIPAPVRTFAGRGDELAAMDQGLVEQQASATVPVVVLVGMGGVGKTQLSLAYAHAQRSRYRIGWWIPAETEVTAMTAMADLAAELGIPTSLRADDLVPRVADRLAEESGWLLVFDNATRVTDIERLVPSSGEGHVLVTSRSPAWRGLGQVIDVSVLSADAATDLLLRRSGDDDEQAAHALAQALGRLPLALDQAAGYVNDAQISLVDYLRLYESRPATLLARGTPAGGYRYSVDRTFTLAMDRLRRVDPAAVRLLELCALFAADDLPVTPLLDHGHALPEPLASACADQLRRHEMVGALVQSGLLTRGGRHRLRIHRLVQAVTMEHMSDDDRRGNTRAAITAMAELFPSGGRPDQWDRCAELASHTQALIDNSSSEDLATPSGARLVQSMGTYLRTRGLDRNLAQRLHQQALDIRRQLYPDDHPEVAESMHQLATSLYWSGEYQHARDLAEQALDMRRRLHRNDHPAVAETMIALSASLFWMGERDRGRELGDEALDILRRIHAEEHPDVADALSNLAAGLYWCGDHQRAVAMAEEALRMRRRLFPGDHPAVAAILGDLAANLSWTGSHERAALIGEEAVDMGRRLNPGDHPTVSWSIIVLADVEHRLGHYQRAYDLHLEGLEMGRRLFRRDRPSTCLSLAGLAAALRELGRPDEAHVRAEEGLAMARRLFPHQDHLIPATALVAAGAAELAVDQADRAYQLNTEALDMARRLVAGRDHLLVVAAMEGLARAAVALGRRRHGAELATEAGGMRQRIERQPPS